MVATTSPSPESWRCHGDRLPCCHNTNISWTGSASAPGPPEERQRVQGRRQPVNISRGAQSREYLTPGCPEDTRSEQSVCVVIVVVTPGCQDAAHNNPGDQPPAQTGDTLTHSHHSQGDTHLQPTPGDITDQRINRYQTLKHGLYW